MRIEQRTFTWNVAHNLIRQVYGHHTNQLPEVVRESSKGGVHAFIYAAVLIRCIYDDVFFRRPSDGSNKLLVAPDRENVRGCFVKREHDDNA